MLGEVFDKATTLFDRRFLLAWWCPTVLSLSIAILLFSWPKNWKPLDQYLSALQMGDLGFRLMIVLGTLLFTFVLAYILQAFSHRFIQFWEGYWPKALWDWYYKNENVETEWFNLKDDRVNAKIENLDSYPFLQEKLFYGYPSEKNRLLPTKLGNTLRAAEDYAYYKYGMHVIFWWPRLWLILPETLQQQIEDSLTPMIAFLNLATQIGMVSIIGSIYLFLQHTGSWEFWAPIVASVTFTSGVILTNLIYQCAVSQAKTYGILIRSVVDLYRFNLLKTLHQHMPNNVVEEKELWSDLFEYLYLNEQGNVPKYVH